MGSTTTMFPKVLSYDAERAELEAKFAELSPEDAANLTAAHNMFYNTVRDLPREKPDEIDEETTFSLLLHSASNPFVALDGIETGFFNDAVQAKSLAFGQEIFSKITRERCLIEDLPSHVDSALIYAIMKSLAYVGDADTLVKYLIKTKEFYTGEYQLADIMDALQASMYKLLEEDQSFDNARRLSFLVPFINIAKNDDEIMGLLSASLKNTVVNFIQESDVDVETHNNDDVPISVTLSLYFEVEEDEN